MKHDDFMPTRRSMIDRLGDWNNQKNWRDFFDVYRPLIFSVARKAGLTEFEADEVVQETLLRVAKNAGDFKYDPAVGSFKSWLLQTTRWRIADQFRKRAAQPETTQMQHRSKDDSRRTATIDRIANDEPCDLDAEWNAEWQRNLLHAALERLKKKIDLKQYQVFDCYVLKEWPAQKVAAELHVRAAAVYLIKHRVSAQLKKEIKAIEKMRPKNERESG